MALKRSRVEKQEEKRDKKIIIVLSILMLSSTAAAINWLLPALNETPDTSFNPRENEEGRRYSNNNKSIYSGAERQALKDLYRGSELSSARSNVANIPHDEKLDDSSVADEKGGASPKEGGINGAKQSDDVFSGSQSDSGFTAVTTETPTLPNNSSRARARALPVQSGVAGNFFAMPTQGKVSNSETEIDSNGVDSGVSVNSSVTKTESVVSGNPISE